MPEIKKEKINNKKINIWIEISAVVLVVCIMSCDFSSLKNFHISSIPQIMKLSSINIDQDYINYTANVFGGFDVVKEEVKNINFSWFGEQRNKLSFAKDQVVYQIQNIESAYTKGINTIKQGSINYANVFSSNLLNNLGVIDRQLHTAKTNFCQ